MKGFSPFAEATLSTPPRREVRRVSGQPQDRILVRFEEGITFDFRNKGRALDNEARPSLFRRHLAGRSYHLLDNIGIPGIILRTVCANTRLKLTRRCTLWSSAS